MSTPALAFRDTGGSKQLARGSLTLPVRMVMLALFVALVCLRMPDIVLKGRLWAEEGIFFENAWSMSPWKALFVSYGGYLNFVANLAGVLARWTVGIEDAPVVTTGLGLLFQVCPAILIVTSRTTWLRSPLAMGASLLALATVPLAEEVWLQTLHSQYHLTLCAALILSFDDAPAPPVLWFRRALLLLGPLCGLTAIVLIPLFALRAAIDRSTGRLIQTALLGLGAAIQLGAFYSATDGTALGRSGQLWLPGIAYAIVLRHVLLPSAGPDAAAAAGTVITPKAHALLPFLVAAPVFGGLFYLCLRTWRLGAVWLFLASAMLAATSYFGAINSGSVQNDLLFGQRYTFMPQVLLVWALIAISIRYRWVAIVPAWWLLVGLALFTRPANWFAHGPSWRSVVAEWRADPSHPMQLWPTEWTMILNPDHRPGTVSH